ncbi:MAG: hypothetical protein Ct9H300mP4_12500 [Gammaproteobacteria bacterium]|nr:MAG: hypothetical protein Ct9H300mP4_12500 [Gammaproteobacteria bacterium]
MLVIRIQNVYPQCDSMTTTSFLPWLSIASSIDSLTCQYPVDPQDNPVYPGCIELSIQIIDSGIDTAIPPGFS